MRLQRLHIQRAGVNHSLLFDIEQILQLGVDLHLDVVAVKIQGPALHSCQCFLHPNLFWKTHVRVLELLEELNNFLLVGLHQNVAQGVYMLLGREQVYDVQLLRDLARVFEIGSLPPALFPATGEVPQTQKLGISKRFLIAVFSCPYIPDVSDLISLDGLLLLIILVVQDRVVQEEHVHEEVVVQHHPEVEKEHDNLAHSAYLLQNVHQRLILPLDSLNFVRKLDDNFCVAQLSRVAGHSLVHPLDEVAGLPLLAVAVGSSEIEALFGLHALSVPAAGGLDFDLRKLQFPALELLCVEPHLICSNEVFLNRVMELL